MRLAWFTPFDRRSAIARFSALVVPQLQRLAAVDIWCPVAEQPLQSAGHVRSFRSAAELADSALSSYDLLIFNLGNHLPYHGDIYEVAVRMPGLCILHDVVMQDFCLAYFLERQKQPIRYLEAMARHYGAQGERLARAILAGESYELFGTEQVMSFPLFEEVLTRAYGVITHSEYARRRVAEGFPGPVRAVYLPYRGPTGQGDMDRVSMEPFAGKVLLLTAGTINRHRRVHSVLRVLAKHRALRERVVYVVLGTIEDRYKLELREFIERERLGAIVQLLGYAEDEMFAAYVRRADVCVNLRWPVTEACSASLIEQMTAGKPVIVTDAGFYSELPSDCVWKIPLEGEEGELSVALERLVERAELRAELGHNARRFAEIQFDVEKYAREVLDFAWEVRGCRPVFDLADRLGRELKDLGIRAGHQVVDVLSRTCAELFSSPGAEAPG